ncbi:PepSY-associated TM helix domain-containing protein [Nocardia macrotermitis]|uniref:Iron-regulated membrane protein n=1 Tax=Nocardia macrotermitis TaxID=2585198 RepID=A0A7K0DBD0_9NOCA|nr:PepSY domain-containing protein [Nocardia macrotermitis]MQY22831.1 hypothetical protein [Nocardia macrotermitis]
MSTTNPPIPDTTAEPPAAPPSDNPGASGSTGATSVSARLGTEPSEPHLEQLAEPSAGVTGDRTGAPDLPTPETADLTGAKPHAETHISVAVLPDTAPSAASGDPAPTEADAVSQQGDGSPGASATAQSSGQPAAQSDSRRAVAALAMRLHFYAGVFVGPFILIAAVTGALYSVAPSIESVVNHGLLHVDSRGAARPLADQVAAAVAVAPKLALVAVDPAQHGGDTTRVLFADPALGESEQRAVFVDPVTAKSVGVSVVYGSAGALPVRTWIDQLHRNLHLGEPGRWYSETAASWMWVVALAGLVVWLRRAGVRRLVWPDRSRKGRARSVNWHAAVGMWVLLPVLFLSATGMTWSTYAGAHVDALRAQLSWTTPSVSSTLAGSGAQHGDSSTVPGMDMPGMSMPGMDMPTSAPAQPSSTDRIAQVDRVFTVARAHHVDGPVEITLPTTDHTAFVVKERRIPGSLTQDAIAVDGSTGHVTDIVRYADWPPMAKLANWGIALHMGTLFGLPNQLLLLLTMVALITVIVRGYLMWWRRRPVRTGRFTPGAPPRRGVLRGIHPAYLAGPAVITVAVGWFAPLLGITLAGFLIIDTAIGLIRRRTTT